MSVTDAATTATANVTDLDSRIMKTKAGYVQGYNAQAVVTGEQIIVAAEVTQQANDVQQLHPLLEQAQENLQTIGHSQAIRTALADAGYRSEANLAAVSVVGSGMQNTPGYASRMFRVLADGNVNIDMITTSEIRISCIIKEEQAEEAVRLLHRGFRLDQPE